MAVKFAPNKVVRVKFKYDGGKEVENKFEPGKMQTMYGVITNEGEDMLYATEYLAEQINRYAPLKDKNLFIEKVVDETNKTRWVITTDGADSFQLGNSALDPRPENAPQVTESSDMQKQIDEIHKMVKVLYVAHQMKSDVPFE